MAQSLDPYDASPEAMAAMLALEMAVAAGALERPLVLLARLRTSQIHRCAWCIDFEYGEARRHGEDPRRLAQLARWRGSALFTPRERAALAWAEFLVRPLPREADAALAAARAGFTGAELAELTLALCAVHGWNRLGRGLRRPPPPLGPA